MDFCHLSYGKIHRIVRFTSIWGGHRAFTSGPWNGFAPYYGRCGGHTVTMFIFVDQIRTFYRKFVLGER